MFERRNLTFKIKADKEDQIISLNMPDGYMANDLVMEGLNSRYRFNVNDKKLIIINSNNRHYEDLTGSTAIFSYSVVPIQESLIDIPDHVREIEINSQMMMSVRSMYNYEYLTGNMSFNEVYHRGRVWTSEQQEVYILNLFKGKAEITPILIEEYDKEGRRRVEVLDGKQRLLTIFDFIENKFPVKDLFFNDLCEKDRKYLLGFSIRYTRITDAHSLDPVSNRFKFEMYMRLNALGVKRPNVELMEIKRLLELED